MIEELKISRERQRWRKSNTTTRSTRANAMVQDVRMRKTMTIGEGTSTLTGRLNSQISGSLDLQRSLFKEIRGVI